MLAMFRKWWGCWHDWVYIDSDMVSYGSWERLHDRVCLKCEKVEDGLSRARVVESERERRSSERMHQAICIWHNRSGHQVSDSLEQLLRPRLPNWPILVFVVMAAAILLAVFQIFFPGG